MRIGVAVLIVGIIFFNPTNAFCADSQDVDISTDTPKVSSSPIVWPDYERFSNQGWRYLSVVPSNREIQDNPYFKDGFPAIALGVRKIYMDEGNESDQAVFEDSVLGNPPYYKSLFHSKDGGKSWEQTAVQFRVEGNWVSVSVARERVISIFLSNFENFIFHKELKEVLVSVNLGGLGDPPMEWHFKNESNWTPQ